jgi:CubicO group peptidase (beta-lactamase class C family)
MTPTGSIATLLSMLPQLPTLPSIGRRRTAPSTAASVRVTALLVPAALLATLTACSTDDQPSAATVGSSAAPAASSDPTETTEPTETPEAIDASADAVATTRAMFAPITADMPGCTVAASRGGEVVFAEAFGAARLDPTAPMTTDSVVDIGSTSKQFTATAVLLLASRGSIDLDAPLSSVLADLPAWADEPSIRQLMHHESGIPDYIGLLIDRGFSLGEVTTDADALGALGEVTDLEFAPGTSWAYSNSNYFLLGQIVLATTGDDLGTFLADEVFGPLDLDMVMDPTAAIAAKAISYEGSGDQRTVADSAWQQLGDGAIQTTPSQLVQWASEYWAPTLDGLTLDTRLDRAPAAVGVPGDGIYGAGIFALDDDGLGRVLRHSGGWGGFVTAFAVAPELEVAIAATCTSPESAASLVTDGDPELELLRIWADSAG